MKQQFFLYHSHFRLTMDYDMLCISFSISPTYYLTGVTVLFLFAIVYYKATLTCVITRLSPLELK